MSQREANRLYYQRHKEQEKARSKKWRQENQAWYKDWVYKNREKLRANSRRYEYNLSQASFEKKLIEQDGKCAICRQLLVRPDVDHDHRCCPGRGTCGKCTRGLLCRSCNSFIGQAQESIEILQNAIQYLKGYQQ